MQITATQLFEKLKNAGIENKTGNTIFTFLGIDAKIRAKSPVGYVFQDWLENWMRSNNIEVRVPDNSQEFPDFYLNPDRNDKDLLEIKTFDADASPNFDVANFDAYTRSLKTKAYRLDSDYLIFSYKMTEDGDFSICDFWLKKVWEITCPSERYAVRAQIKQDVIVNIRPANWSSSNPQFQVFESRKAFVKALYETLLAYPSRRDVSQDWYEEVATNYKLHTGNNL
jgi:type II restriction enzyme